MRNAQAEIAAWINHKIAAVFDDYETFFDTIDIPTSLVESIYTEFPPIQMSIALQQHLAPRVIQATGFSDEPGLVYKSMLAECRHSVAMTRTLLLRSMKTIVKSNIQVHTKVHVDDTAMLAVERSRNSAVDSVVQTVLKFANQVKHLKLKLSSKGVIVCTDIKMSLYIRKNCKTTESLIRLIYSLETLGSTSMQGNLPRGAC